MGTITINSDELKQLIKESFIDVLTSRRDLIEDAIVEAIEDIGLGIAMEEERTGEYIDNKEFIEKLKIEMSSLCNLRNNSELKMRQAVIKFIIKFNKLTRDLNEINKIYNTPSKKLSM